MYFKFVSVIVLFYCVSLHVNALSIDVPVDNSTNKAEAVLRCFCDLPSCITGGYMCKSAGFGCFTESDQSFSPEKARRGCLELLPNKQQACQNVPRTSEPQLSTTLAPNSTTLVLCCTKDLCNHPDTPNKSNESSPAGGMSASVKDPLEKLVMIGNAGSSAGSNPRIMTHRPINYYSSNEFWFRAATIVVPIFGALILFALIVLAVKLLRSESLENSGPATKLKHNKHDRFPPNLNSSTTQIIHHFQDLTTNKKMPLLEPHSQLQQQQNSDTSPVSRFSSLKNCENTNNNIFSSNILNTKNENYAKINNIDGNCNSGILTEILTNNNNNNNFSINRLSSGYNLLDIQKQTNPLLNYNLFFSDVNNLDESNSLLQEPNRFSAPVESSESNKVTYKKAIDSSWSDKL